MNIQIETITTHDGSKMDVIRDVEKVAQLIKDCDPRYAAFGRKVFKLVTSRVSDMVPDESNEEILEIAEEEGLAQRVDYDPELHGEICDVEPGDTIWWWGKPL